MNKFPQPDMRIPLLLLTWTMLIGAAAQTGTPVMDATIPQEYEIGGITVSGTVTTDPNAVKLFTGLQVGDKVTVHYGEKQALFGSDVLVMTGPKCVR